MNIKGNPVINLLLALGIVIVCLAAIPLAAKLGLLFLYIEPNPRHMPNDLTGEAVGWAIIGLMTGLMVTVVAETLIWQTQESFWAKYKGLALGSVISLIVGAALGMAFAVTLAGSFTVDAQAITSAKLGTLAGGTASVLGAVAGIVAGATLRRYLINLSRLPGAGARQSDSPSAP